MEDNKDTAKVETVEQETTAESEVKVEETKVEEEKPTEETIDTVELLNQLRNTCESLIGEDFKYSDIYNEFYKVKK